ncbi:flp pilus-assembly TadE/G-like family protein [Gordonia sp. TBRC 11910]|uniref:Flp pilus-assembly TadE/G-like family protein n=1 Tax=Gordonia asplenii TaxID=2725283 RepID=A0A848L572_9ACTN|nr:Rv3654c family TadE-like protein [Gordonia asplenii]NMO02768.1 flp pilus-assembly TadE/G-like family protein [Gordonia asplenii]
MRSLFRDERGAATVLAAWVIGVLVVIVVLMLYVGAAIVARHRAQSTADLAALAGAIAHLSGDDACARVDVLAQRQQVRAEVTGCHVVDDDVTVTVAVGIDLGHWGIRAATATARAGPVDG